MEGKAIGGHNMKLKRGIAAMLLAVSLAVSLLPARVMPAQAEETAGTGKAIVLGTNAIQDPTTTTNGSGSYYTPNSYIYFGVNSGNSDTPIKWRVLDADQANDGTTAGMFLLSEYVLDTLVQFGTDEREDGGQSNPDEWQNSNAQSWCTTFASNTSNFTTAEQSSMLGIAKSDSEGIYYDIPFGTSALTTSDKLFFLSAEELSKYVGSYNRAPGLVAKSGAEGSACDWWLRSPHEGMYEYEASCVNYIGDLNEASIFVWLAARPAFNLSLDSILFTSAAAGGKASGTVGAGALTSISTYDGSEWKLTLLDSSRSFAVTETSATAGAGDTITLTYAGATVYSETTAPNEYISVILSDESGIQYYGRVLQPASADGTVDITIPSGLALGTYTLNVFSEQYNGDCRTDYASAFDTVELTVKKSGSVTITGDDLSKTYDGNAVGIPTYSALSSGEVTVKYKRQDADATTYTTVAPKDAGEYTVLVTVAGDSTYTEASATADFTIYPKELTVTVNDVIKKYDDDNPTFTYTVTDGELAKGDTLEDLGITLSTAADKDSAVGSYAITGTSDSTCYDVTVIAGTLKVVTLFTLPEQDFPDDGADHMLAIEVGLSEVPEALRSNPNLDTVEEIEALLKTVVCTQSGYSEDHTVIYDVTLMVSFDGGLTWVEATEDNFPADGLTVILPYPDGTSKDTHDFTVTHMFTKAAFGKTPGETETSSVTKTDDGIQVTVTGLSPIIIAWKDVETEVTTTDEAATSVETGDSTFLWLLLALMGMSGCLGIYFVAYCKKEGK